MAALSRVLPWFVLAFALLGLALGYYEMSHPPFTDEQLKASAVDTWEVANSTTRVFGIVFLGLSLVCAFLARNAVGAANQIVAWVAAVTCLLTLMLFLHNHIELTQRTADLTGREFGPLYGLL
jgi:uncharacterized membrane protein